MTRSERLLILCAVAVVAVLAAAIATPRREPVVQFFDIGQGDAVLIQQGNMQMLVDGGPDGNVLAKLGEAMPFFDRTIEMVVVTHPDKDHFGGITDVLSRYRVGTVMLDGAEDAGPSYQRFAEALARNGAHVVVGQAGDAVRLTDRIGADVLWPPLAHESRIQNDLSLVMRLMVDGAPAALLTGDTTDAVEPLIARSSVQAPILKVGHHGSAHSTSGLFLETVRPTVAVISVGVRNSYGHPAASVLYRLSSRGIAVLRTDEDGDLRATFSGGARVCTVPILPFTARCVTAD